MSRSPTLKRLLPKMEEDGNNSLIDDALKILEEEGFEMPSDVLNVLSSFSTYSRSYRRRRDPRYSSMPTFLETPRHTSRDFSFNDDILLRSDANLPSTSSSNEWTTIRTVCEDSAIKTKSRASQNVQYPRETRVGEESRNLRPRVDDRIRGDIRSRIHNEASDRSPIQLAHSSISPFPERNTCSNKTETEYETDSGISQASTKAYRSKDLIDRIQANEPYPSQNEGIRLSDFSSSSIRKSFYPEANLSRERPVRSLSEDHLQSRNLDSSKESHYKSDLCPGGQNPSKNTQSSQDIHKLDDSTYIRQNSTNSVKSGFMDDEGYSTRRTSITSNPDSKSWNYQRQPSSSSIISNLMQDRELSLGQSEHFEKDVLSTRLDTRENNPTRTNHSMEARISRKADDILHQMATEGSFETESRESSNAKSTSFATDSSAINIARIERMKCDSMEKNMSRNQSAETIFGQVNRKESESLISDSTELNTARTESTKTDLSETNKATNELMRLDSEVMSITRTDSIKNDSREWNADRSECMNSNSSKINLARSDTIRTDSAEVNIARSDSEKADSKESKMSLNESMKTDSAEVNISRRDMLKTDSKERHMARSETVRVGEKELNTTKSESVVSDSSERNTASNESMISDLQATTISRNESMKRGFKETNTTGREITKTGSKETSMTRSESIKSDTSENNFSEHKVITNDSGDVNSEKKESLVSRADTFSKSSTTAREANQCTDLSQSTASKMKNYNRHLSSSSTESTSTSSKKSLNKSLSFDTAESMCFKEDNVDKKITRKSNTNDCMSKDFEKPETNTEKQLSFGRKDASMFRIRDVGNERSTFPTMDQPDNGSRTVFSSKIVGNSISEHNKDYQKQIPEDTLLANCIRRNQNVHKQRTESGSIRETSRHDNLGASTERFVGSALSSSCSVPGPLLENSALNYDVFMSSPTGFGNVKSPGSSIHSKFAPACQVDNVRLVGERKIMDKRDRGVISEDLYLGENILIRSRNNPLSLPQEHSFNRRQMDNLSYISDCNTRNLENYRLENPPGLFESSSSKCVGKGHNTESYMSAGHSTKYDGERDYAIHGSSSNYSLSEATIEKQLDDRARSLRPRVHPSIDDVAEKLRYSSESSYSAGASKAGGNVSLSSLSESDYMSARQEKCKLHDACDKETSKSIIPRGKLSISSHESGFICDEGDHGIKETEKFSDVDVRITEHVEANIKNSMPPVKESKEITAVSSDTRNDSHSKSLSEIGRRNAESESRPCNLKTGLETEDKAAWEQRRQRIDKALSWIRSEMNVLRTQDKVLMSQFQRCQESIEQLKQQRPWLSENYSDDEDDERHWEDWEIEEFDRRCKREVEHDSSEQHQRDPKASTRIIKETLSFFEEERS